MGQKAGERREMGVERGEGSRVLSGPASGRASCDGAAVQSRDEQAGPPSRTKAQVFAPQPSSTSALGGPSIRAWALCPLRPRTLGGRGSCASAHRPHCSLTGLGVGGPAWPGGGRGGREGWPEAVLGLSS